MKNFVQITCIVCIALLIASEAFCADDTYPVGFGVEIGAGIELPLGFDIGLFGEIHTCQTFETLEHYCFIVHAGNAILPWLRVDAGYQFLDINNAEHREGFADGWNKMHRRNSLSSDNCPKL